MNLTSKLASLALVGTLVMTSIASPAMAHDQRNHNNDAAVAFGIIAGTMLGIALSDRGHRHVQPQGYYRQPVPQGYYAPQRRINCTPIVVGNYVDRNGTMHNRYAVPRGC